MPCTKCPLLATNRATEALSGTAAPASSTVAAPPLGVKNNCPATPARRTPSSVSPPPAADVPDSTTSGVCSSTLESKCSDDRVQKCRLYLRFGHATIPRSSGWYTNVQFGGRAMNVTCSTDGRPHPWTCRTRETPGRPHPCPCRFRRRLRRRCPRPSCCRRNRRCAPGHDRELPGRCGFSCSASARGDQWARDSGHLRGVHQVSRRPEHEYGGEPVQPIVFRRAGRRQSAGPVGLLVILYSLRGISRRRDC